MGQEQPEFDDQDARMLAKRVDRREEQAGPRIGDFVKMLDGTTRRFTHDWGEDIQTTCKDGLGSFHLTAGGDGNYSGGLDAAISKSGLEETGKTLKGAFWFFHHDRRRAHNGVYFKTPCRVFAQVAP